MVSKIFVGSDTSRVSPFFCPYSVLDPVGIGLAAGFYEVLKSRAVHDVELVAFSTNKPARVELVQGVGGELSRRAGRTRQVSDRREWLDDP